MDLLFKFHIRLNASYLDAKRVRTWEIDENPLELKSSEEARSNQRPPTQIAALTFLNITLVKYIDSHQLSTESNSLVLLLSAVSGT